MQVQENYPLKKYNTFGIDAYAKQFAAFSSMEELKNLLDHRPHGPLLLLGGGSNILFTKNFNGLVLKNEITGIHTVHEDEHHVYIKAGAGENWHNLVMHCVKNDLGGMENLSLIPGNVGASPMQNIGAYGVEVRDVFHSLEALHLDEGHVVNFSSNDCGFGYRESVFKKKYKDEYAILSVTYRLDKIPAFRISYGAIQAELGKMGITALSIRSISQAVINIRRSKLPDPAVIGNAGSFFKNPEVSEQRFAQLKLEYETMPGYPVKDGRIKIAAGWLIEQCGWKGFRRGEAGCYEKQALVLVNYGNAGGDAIFDLATEIKESVKEKFDIELETEVNII